MLRIASQIHGTKLELFITFGTSEETFQGDFIEIIILHTRISSKEIRS
jgi:hypothetical protein